MMGCVAGCFEVERVFESIGVSGVDLYGFEGSLFAQFGLRLVYLGENEIADAETLYISLRPAVDFLPLVVFDGLSVNQPIAFCSGDDPECDLAFKVYVCVFLLLEN
jgi:hypothetical protein